MSSPQPCVVCSALTVNELVLCGTRSYLCSDACRSKAFSRSQPRERVAHWVTFSANEQGLAGRRSEMYKQGVRVEVYHNTEHRSRIETFFLDDLRRDDVTALRAIVDMLRAPARADDPLPPQVVLYPVETSRKLLSSIVVKLSEHT